MQTDQLVLLSLGLYLIGFLLTIGFRNALSDKFIGLISISLNVFGFLISLGLFNSFSETQVFQYDWIELKPHTFYFSILINKLTVLMFALVQGIALLVQLFSTKYMKADPRLALYFGYLNLFIFSMLGLVISGNLLFMFVFWELVGFCSYLLIGFWYHKDAAADAALKAFIMNRIGDAGFLIGIALVFYQFQTLELSSLSQLSLTNADLTVISLCLFCGCIGKSAQLPLQVWLPDAMEGPTPASALIHAATMVAAGIFLLARVDFLISPIAGVIIAGIGSLTALLAAYSAIFQSDIKKVLAYSTVSQLGLMVMAMGAGATNAALFHLYTHAFFKAGLFLIAGAVIHHLHHEQNMFKMGGLLKSKPILAFAYIICGGALAGLPLSSGFLSKDAIILSVWNWAIAQQNPLVLLIPTLGILASIMTGFYVSRQFVLVFLRKNKTEKMQWRMPTRLEWAILPLCVASFGFFHGINPFTFEDSIFSSWFEIHHQDNHWLAYFLVFCAIAAMVYAYQRFELRKKEIKPENTFAKLGLSHFGLNYFYVKGFAPALVGKPVPIEKVLNPNTITQRGTNISGILNKIDIKIVDGFIGLLASFTVFLAKLSAFIDKNLIDGVISQLYGLVENIGLRLKRIQNGKIQSYLITSLLIFVTLLIILTLR